MFDYDKKRDLYVPDTSLPAGAAVGADGTVACVTCEKRLLVEDADIVGQGYRCPACSATAHVNELTTGKLDASANFSADQAAALRAAGRKQLFVGIALVVLGGAVMPFIFKVGFGIVLLGLGTAGTGLARIRSGGG